MDTEHLLSQYVVPNPADREVVILTTDDLAGGIYASKTNLFALNTEALEILRDSFLGGETRTLRGCVEARPEMAEPTARWIRDITEDGLLVLSSAAPKVARRNAVPIEAGGSLPAGPDEDSVPVDFAGTVTQVTVNRTRVVWYSATDTPMEMAKAAPRMGVATSVSGRGPLGTSLYPSPVEQSLGVNCAGCALCAACGACVGCVLCGGVNFGVALIGLDTTLGTIGVAAASSAFEATRATMFGG